MSYGWNRTDEFFHLVQLHAPQTHQPLPSSSQSIDGLGASRARHAPASRSSQAAASDSSGLNVEETQFSKDAVVIGHELGQAERKTGELQKLARHRGIFEDRSSEIQALSYDIRQTIIALNGRIDALERLVQSSSSGPHNQVHHRSVVQTLRTRLGEVTRGLKVILEERAQAMKNQEERRSLYSHSASAAPRFHEDDSNVPTGSGDLEAGGLLQGSRMQKYAPRESSYHSARAEAVETVQKMIGELAQIFNRVATLVTAQEELTVRIEDDMSSALHNLQQGEAHLIKYLRSISSNRSLILKVFAILILFIVFFIIFLA